MQAAIKIDLVSEVRCHNVGIGSVFADTQSHVTLAIEHDKRRCVCNEHVDTQIELPTFQ